MINVVIDTSICGCYNFYDGTLYYFGRLAVEQMADIFNETPLEHVPVVALRGNLMVAADDGIVHDDGKLLCVSTQKIPRPARKVKRAQRENSPPAAGADSLSRCRVR